MRWIQVGIMFVAVGFSAAQAAAAKPAEIAYLFQPVVGGSTPALAVDLWFQGDASGSTRLRLPSEWAGQKQLYNAVRDLRAVTRGAVLSETSDPGERRIISRGAGPIHLRYRVVRDSGGPVRHESFYRAMVQPSFFHLVGHTFLVTPDWDEDRDVSVTLRWENFPESWSLADSFGAGQRVQRFLRRMGNLRHALYAGGDYRLRRREVDGRPVWTAVRGAWKFTDEAFSDLAEKVIRTERDFWRDDRFPFYLITLNPIEGSCCSAGGTGLTDAFAAFATPEQTLDVQMIHLLAHEFFHTWNGGKINRVDPEELVYWFSEGFTDYYTYLLSLRAGLITLPEHIKEYNETLRHYYASPARTAPNDRILKDFWKDRDVEMLPYQRGAILAHNWNARIKLRSKGSASLDDFMRALLRAAEADGVKVSSASIEDLMKPYLPEGIARDIQEYVDAGQLIPPEPRSLGPCAALEMKEIPEFQLGFDWDASDPTKTIRGIVAGSAAYAAGLRDGQKILGDSIYFGDPTKEVVITVPDGTREREIKYWPHRKPAPGRGPSRVPQFRLDEKRFRREPAACLRWFGV